MRYFLGVDPGQAGALAVLTAAGDLESVVPLPYIGGEPMAADIAALLLAVASAEDLFVALEEPFAVRQNSSQSSLTQGVGYGILLGVVGTLGLRHERIKPTDWKRELGLPMGKQYSRAEKKNHSRKRASQLWPTMAEHWARATQDGPAEAALIGEAVRRRVIGSQP